MKVRRLVDDLRWWLHDWWEEAERLRWWLDDVRLWPARLTCRVRGHADRVRGDWPEDRVCPRCGDLEVCAGFSVDIVRPDDEAP